MAGWSALNWGTTEAERGRTYGCDRILADPAGGSWYRAIDVAAPPPVVFRWLAQLRVAPYSFDWLDNFGRRSPRELIPGLDQLAVGQRVMTIFTLVDLDRGREITVQWRPRFGPRVVVSYAVEARGKDAARLLVKVRSSWNGAGVNLLARGDSIMMSKQLRTLASLAETTAAAAAAGATPTA